MGNYILLDLGNGVYAGCAHLRRGSLQVSVGKRVTAGQEIAECGNSGNSSEPHLHFQLMDGPDVMTAHGLPFEWHYRDDHGMESDRSARGLHPCRSDAVLGPPGAGPAQPARGVVKQGATVS
ncbi:M23 family metallopeptidase [Streptomyces sp. NPDC051644]|uniref:M23 family metallopeptidase n=1 Tax=Streptomyces sp. NPDC051644 TaxID=3365666 RepID=UPI0037A668DC